MAIESKPRAGKISEESRHKLAHIDLKMPAVFPGTKLLVDLKLPDAKKEKK